MKEPLISVVMSVYKERDEWLRAAIESILNQSFSDFEFIIVNDNPTDKRIRHVLIDYAQKDERIRVVENECNKGLVYSLNHGLEYAHGEYVARMDADDISLPTRFADQLGYLTANACDIVSAYVDWIDENDETIKSTGARAYSPELVVRQLKYDNMVSHPTWLVKTDIYRRLGGYRDIYSAEDYDFLLRAVSEGCRIGICDKILLKYRINTSGISRKNALKQMLTSKYLRKHMGELDEVTQDDINAYIAKRYTAGKDEKYSLAREIMRKASGTGKVRACLLFFKAILVSAYAFENIKCMIALRIIRMGYKHRKA